MKKLLFTSLFVLLAFFNINAQEELEVVEPSNLDMLLELVKEGKSKEQAENDRREDEFISARNRQGEILAAEQRELARQERIADELEEVFIANQEKLRIAEEAYLKQLGSLNELFGHMQSISTDSRVTFETSLTAAEFGKERETFLGDLTSKMGESTELPTILEIERVWYEIMREMKATGEVDRFNTNVINVDGSQAECDVVRIGVYNAVCGSSYLEYVPSKGQYQFLARQPAGRYTGSASRVSNADAASGYVSFSVDPSGPSGGALLANLIQNPSLLERINQGGFVCNIIILIFGPNIANMNKIFFVI